jgi:serine/threonine protein phosphatase PrpC/Na+-transporting methylmalonyl-CoA/oxaloacetate decarboxylase gamma subunit
MSTQRFMASTGKGPGRFAFALFIGALLALQCLLPSAAFARSKGPAVAFSSTTQQNYVRDKVGVSLVRLLATYSNGAANAHMTCTGLGILVASANQGPSFQNWVLTDGGLVRAKMSTCGFAGGTIPLSEIQIWASSEYANSTQGHLLGLLTCTTQQNNLTCKDESGTSTLGESVTTVASVGQSSYTLFPFQTSAQEPYLSPDFTFNPSSLSNRSEVALTNGTASQSGQVYPSATVSEKENPQSYLKPEVINPALNPGGVPPVSTGSNTIEGGTPIVSDAGKLVGMFASLGNGTTSPLLTTVQTIWSRGSLPAQPPSVTSAQSCTSVAQTAACWNAGIDAFYGAPALTTPQYTVADSYFSRMMVANKQTGFQAPVYFDEQALHSSSSHGRPTTPTQQTSTGSPISSWLLLIGLGALLIVLALLLVLVTLLVGRARRRRRELERFAAEQLEAQRIAEAEVQRQRAQQAQAQSRETTCPNCHKPVRVSDAMCPHCRYPLSPTASGLNVRLMGNAPLSATSISEQPTVQFPPAPAATSNGDGGETTTRRKKPVQDEPTYHFQQARGRNLSLIVGTRSDPGIKRKHKPNEDSLFAIQGARTHNSQPQQFGLFVVADGMGGHANGQDASRLAIQTMIDFMLPKVTSSEPMDDEAFLKLMSDGVQNANQAVHMRNLEARADMGTTMTTALVVGSTAYVANVGDSRTYLYREGQGLTKVTTDHSVVASLVEAGIIQPDDIYTHPKRNQIYRSLGEKPVVEVDTFKVDLQPGDKLLLCTDGLWDMTRDPIIQQIMSKPTRDPNKTSQELIKAALDGGGEDNVSVIVAQFSESTEPTGQTGVQLLAKPESVTVPDLPQV